MFCLFVRFLPMVATSEVKTVLPEANPHGHADAGHRVSDHGTALPLRGGPTPEGAS
jgi:hypothetical protein